MRVKSIVPALEGKTGFYHTDSQGFRIYMVLTETYKNELCKGFDQRAVTRVLLQAGWLKPASDGKASHKPRIKGVARQDRMCLPEKFGEVNKN
ncbi:inner membrane protein [Legionella pneumophila]|nr:inner membrane protein [Legionella pneumophila]